MSEAAPRPIDRHLFAGFLRQHRGAAVAVTGWSLLEAVPALASGLLVAAALDRGFLAGRPAEGFFWIGLLGAAMVFRALMTRTLTPWLGRIVEPLRDDLVTAVAAGAVHRAAAGARDTAGAGVARLTVQVETVRALVSALLRSARQLGVSLLMAFVGLAALSAPVAAVTLPPVLLTLLLCVPRLRVLARRQRRQLRAEERLTGAAGETFDGIRDVVACGARDRVADELSARITDHRDAVRAVARTASANALLVSLGSHLPLLVLLLSAPRLLDSGALSVGELLGATSYLVSGVAPALRALVAVLGSWGVQLATVLGQLSRSTREARPGPRGQARPGPPREAQPGQPGEARPGPPGGSGEALPPQTFRTPRTPRTPRSPDLSLVNVVYAYGPGAAPVIDGLTLDIPAGSHLTVVGPSGAGKSTLTTLLAGMAGPDSGRLTLGGVPATEVDRAWLHRAVTLIPQEAYVFTGTVRDNLRYLRPEARDTDLLASATAVGARALVDRLGGLDAPVGLDGPPLSSGERQLVALARAHVSPASIVLLDEACCHLDPAAEERAERAFAERGTTLVVVAHRISSALRAPRVLVLDGDRTDVGSPAQLLHRSPLYADLVGHWVSAGAP
ncbi:ABC transporter ATP-binding protein [Streptomyces sp. PTY087I2]|uniref:ATP-binding cassette domain-containing protein n=1 Tax=Streptomyces sp. PTY087I2 TaxID=1819298 RepID=UPI00080BFEF7|nr:ABC transporter ATP-binding protein [Streptomyces sp. PTY087I2]OCC08589.1 putative ABC transporter ATP-binding protein [Streptomyces sp. PTY087I2]